MTESPQHTAWRNRPAHEKHLSFVEWLRNAPDRAAGSLVAPDSLRSPSKSKYRAQRTGKYASKREAKEVRDRRSKESGIALSCYRCANCGGYHLCKRENA